MDIAIAVEVFWFRGNCDLCYDKHLAIAIAGNFTQYCALVLHASWLLCALFTRNGHLSAVLLPAFGMT